MIFTEARFFILFGVVFVLYWALTSNASRKNVLLLASCVFYGAWDWRYLGLMFASITLDYAMGLALESSRNQAARRTWIVVSVVANLTILGFFKYYGFFVDSAIAALEWLGLHPSPRTLEVLLPAGISFYTFQSMSYTIDVYRRQMPAVKSYIDFALFVSFFPQLVAGPIVRAIDFMPQLAVKKLWKDVDVRGCLALFLVGYVKKACIADHVAVGADAVFKKPQLFDATGQWLGIALYHVQVYCDISGYTDMALGCAGLLGYSLCVNFDFPHLSRSISDWWRRWHISVSSWFRDYLYFPLGGSSLGPGRTLFNLFVVFFLCGLWHGAAWNFVVFGLYQGVLLVAHRAWSDARPKFPVAARITHALGFPATTLILFSGWVIFRSEGVDNSIAMARTAVGLDAGGSQTLTTWWLVLIAVVSTIHVLAYRKITAGIFARVPHWLWGLGYGVAFALALQFSARGHKPFIYFQF